MSEKRRSMRPGEFMLDRKVGSIWLMVNRFGKYYPDYHSAKREAKKIIASDSKAQVRVRSYWGGIVWDNQESNR